MKIGILGFGREGQSTLGFIKRNKEFKNSEIWILDKDKKLQIPQGTKSRLGNDYLKYVGDFDIVFRSPGIPYLLPEFQKARAKGVVFSSLTKLFFANCKATIIGVTGTKGKGTTSNIIYRILKAAGKKAYLVGNIGQPSLDILPKLTKDSYVVLELSSFQLQDLEVSPKIAAVLDTFPDHQDAHKNLAEYYASKSNIARYQTPKDKVYFFSDNAMSRKVARPGSGRKVSVNPSEWKLFRPEELKIPGPHQYKNAVMAATIALGLGISKRTVRKAVISFPGWEHRLEFVRRFKNISFYNDSASTNPQTTAAVIKSFPGQRTVIIAGGKDKNLDYAPLKQALRKPIETVILMGENRNKIKKTLNGIKTPLLEASSLKAAIEIAVKIAGRQSSPANIVLSPGAASFDMFKSYADRGRQFKDLVKSIK